MFLSGCLVTLKTLCMGALLLFNPGTQADHPQVVMTPPPVCVMDEASACEMLNASSYQGIDNPRLVRYFSQDPACPRLLADSTIIAALYGCDTGDEVCFSSVRVYAEHYSMGRHRHPASTEEIEETQREVDFIGSALQRRCDKEHKPFVWDPKDFERREFMAGYKAKKE